MKREPHNRRLSWNERLTSRSMHPHTIQIRTPNQRTLLINSSNRNQHHPQPKTTKPQSEVRPQGLRSVSQNEVSPSQTTDGYTVANRIIHDYTISTTTPTIPPNYINPNPKTPTSPEEVGQGLKIP
jgi:hypothetical protein